MASKQTTRENGKLIIRGRKKKQTNEADTLLESTDKNIEEMPEKTTKKIELLQENNPIIIKENNKIKENNMSENIETVQAEEYSPFSEQPIIRDSGLGGNQSDNTQPISQEKVIPEPDITPEDDNPASVGGSGVGGVGSEQSQGTDNANSGDGTQPDTANADIDGGGSPMTTESLSPTDKHNAAKAGAEEAVNLYCTYKPMLFTFIAKPSEKKIKELIKKGELNPNIMIETADTTATFKEHIESINSACEDAYNPSDDFKERIVPPLTRIFEKHNMGLTDEQQVLAIVGQDLLTSSIQLYQIKGMQKELLEHACDITKQLEVNNAEKNSQLRQKNNELKQKENEIEEMRRRYEEMMAENQRLKNSKDKPVVKKNADTKKVEKNADTKKAETNVIIDEGDVPTVLDTTAEVIE